MDRNGLRPHLAASPSLVQQVGADSDLGEDDAMRIAVEETRAVRTDRTATAGCADHAPTLTRGVVGEQSY